MNAERAGSRRFAEVLAEAVSQVGAVSDPQSVPDYLGLVEIAAGIETEARSLLHESVNSARSAGATWSAVGGTLGMSKQAAQKRFATQSAPVTSELDPNERVLGPVTAFDEMAELALAGEYGWHSVDFGTYFHRVVHSETKWEHVRVSALTRNKVESMQADGWQVIGSVFPFTYLKRNLGTPALLEPSGEPHHSRPVRGGSWT